MKDILQRLLKKRGIENIDTLSIEEKETFNNWQEILSKEEITPNDIKLFCINQISIIESKWADLKIEQKKKAELIPYHVVYKTLIAVIESPKAVREGLEKHLNQLLNE